jgi:hypothetical protein
MSAQRAWLLHPASLAYSLRKDPLDSLKNRVFGPTHTKPLPPQNRRFWSSKYAPQASVLIKIFGGLPPFSYLGVPSASQGPRCGPGSSQRLLSRI